MIQLYWDFCNVVFRSSHFFGFCHLNNHLPVLYVLIRKKLATAVAFAKQGRGLIKVNGQPIENIEPESLRLKAFEPVLILGQDKFSNLDIRVRVKGGGITAQIYAIRAAIAKSVVAYHAKYVDESSKNELRCNFRVMVLRADARDCPAQNWLEGERLTKNPKNLKSLSGKRRKEEIWTAQGSLSFEALVD